MSSNEKQSKTEYNVTAHQNKDKDKSGDYMMHGADANKDKNQNQGASITFEKKKVEDKDKDLHSGKDWNKDKDLNKDLHKDKDWNKDKDFNKDLHKDKDMHDKDKSEGGIINTIKEKVKDVLGSGDNDKNKDKDWNKDKDVHMSSGSDYNKNKDVHMSSDYNKSSDKYASSNAASIGSAHQQQQPLASSDISSGHQAGYVGASDKQFSGSAGAGYSGSAQKTVDKQNLGAEHREVGYEKPSVIPSKEKEKDSTHKVDVHGSLYTSGAGSTFKTNEAK